jgi:hypothetical protein
METNKSKLLWIAVLGLLILNFGTLAFIWLHHGRGGHEPPHGNVAGFIIHELNFSDEQIKKFDLLKESHHQQIENTQQTVF